MDNGKVEIELGSKAMAWGYESGDDWFNIDFDRDDFLDYFEWERDGGELPEVEIWGTGPNDNSGHEDIEGEGNDEGEHPGVEGDYDYSDPEPEPNDYDNWGNDYDDWDYDWDGANGGGETNPNGSEDVPNLLKKWEAFKNESGDKYKRLTDAERTFIIRYPVVSASFLRNATAARDECGGRYPNEDYVNTIRDAFRHAYWCALNAYDWGEGFAKLYGDAHEAYPITSSLSSAEKAMDLYNNGVVSIIGQQVRDEAGDRTDILERIQEIADKGGLHTIEDYYP